MNHIDAVRDSIGAGAGLELHLALPPEMPGILRAADNGDPAVAMLAKVIRLGRKKTRKVWRCSVWGRLLFKRTYAVGAVKPRGAGYDVTVGFSPSYSAAWQGFGGGCRVSC